MNLEEVINKEREITVDSDVNKWYLKTIANCRTGLRRKSIVELLFCMLRAKEG